MVRRQLRKKANALIVDRKEEVLALLAEIRTREFAPLPPPGARAAVVRCAISVEEGAPIAADLKLTVAPFDGSAEVVSWWTAVAARLEAVGLPLEGEGAETWGARLKIGKKGGGEHFDESQRRDADAAYGRVGALYEYASLSSQLREKAEQLSRIAAALEVQKEMSRLKRLERFATLQSQAITLATRVADGRAAAERSFTAAGLPATLGDSVAAVWAALPALRRDALALAADDYDSWRAEASAAKKRFKTTHCHALLRAVVALAAELRAQLAAAAALTEADIDALRLLDEREAELAEAAAGAKAALAEELNDDV